MIRGEFFIPGTLPALNELLAASRRNAHVYNRLKSTSQAKVALCARELPRFPGSVRIWYEFREPSRRRDPNNLVAGGMKIIDDALVEGGFIGDDGWKFINGIHPTWRHDKTNPGIRVTILGEETQGEGLPDSA